MPTRGSYGVVLAVVRLRVVRAPSRPCVPSVAAEPPPRKVTSCEPALPSQSGSSSSMLQPRAAEAEPGVGQHAVTRAGAKVFASRLVVLAAAEAVGGEDRRGTGFCAVAPVGV